ncbi:MAG: hypothetical protein R2731_10440 [Nocardioides sp.]
MELPVPPAGSGSAYVRLQYRRQMEIAVVGAAAYVELDGDTVRAARVAITALTPVICRVPDAEAALVGHRLGGNDTAEGGNSAVAGQTAVDAAAEAASTASTPISDVRPPRPTAGRWRP